jgi:hypothetical protein
MLIYAINSFTQKKDKCIQSVSMLNSDNIDKWKIAPLIT